MFRRLLGHARHHSVGYVALFFAVSGTALGSASFITKSETITSGDLAGSKYGDPVIGAHKVTNTKLAHASLSVNSGTGLSGGGAIGLGGQRTLSLRAPFQLPQSCTSGQVPKSSGSGSWACAADENSGGTVTSVDSGTGLTGGPITGSGALSLASGYQLPQSCNSGQVATSDGSGGWSCGNVTFQAIVKVEYGSPSATCSYFVESGPFTPALTSSGTNGCSLAGWANQVYVPVVTPIFTPTADLNGILEGASNDSFAVELPSLTSGTGYFSVIVIN